MIDLLDWLLNSFLKNFTMSPSLRDKRWFWVKRRNVTKKHMIFSQPSDHTDSHVPFHQCKNSLMKGSPSTAVGNKASVASM